MNSNTGQLYGSVAEAIRDLGPGEKPSDIVEVVGDPDTVQALSRSIQQLREIEKRRAANKAARKSRRANR